MVYTVEYVMKYNSADFLLWSKAGLASLLIQYLHIYFHYTESYVLHYPTIYPSKLYILTHFIIFYNNVFL